MVLLMSACAPGGQAQPQATIVVGSKDFAEQFIIGEMYALLLENANFKVERKLNLGATPALQDALVNGKVDLYPEYTGTGLSIVLKMPTRSDPQQVYDTVAKEYKDRYKLIWLDRSPMNNTYALAMPQTSAARYGIKTMSDMAANADKLTMVGPPEMVEREDGLPGIKRVYGNFELKRFIPVDPNLRYKALNDMQADVVVGFATDGEISAYNLVVLKDDKGLYPPYQIAPVVRQQTLEAHPTIRNLLNALAPKLTDQVMQRLNNEVTGKKRAFADVAKEFLVQEGLIKGTK
jgi:osmoprotectant transport system substrate-binding protein